MRARPLVPFLLNEPAFFGYSLEAGRLHGVEVLLTPSHRQVEPMAGAGNIHQTLALVERICVHCGNSHPFAYCMALEQIGGIALPERAEHLRVLADEMKRVSSHLFGLALTMRRAGLEPLARQIMDAREIILVANEALFGNRVTLAVNRIGGVAADLDGALLAWLRERLAELTEAMPVFEKALSPSGAFARRTRGLGRLDAADSLRLALVGPTARASGLACDVRRNAPYAVYDRLEFLVPTHADGDVWARSQVRFREVGQSLSLIAQCLAGLPDGPIACDELPEIPAGEAISKCESPEGELIYYLKTDGSERPRRLKWRSAAHNNWRALPELLEGARPGDVPLIIGSLGPCIEG